MQGGWCYLTLHDSLLILISAATYIMNDDLDSAEAGLDPGKSAFHKVSLQKGGALQHG